MTGQEARHHAHVDLTNGHLVVTSYDQVEPGLCIIGEHAAALPEGADHATVGRAVREALSLSLPNAERVAYFALKPRMERLQKLAGVKSNRAYLKGAKSVLLACADNCSTLTLTPTKNRAGSFEQCDQPTTVLLADLSDDALGQVVRSVLARCIQ
ncbi:hypothetical protein [Catellatospora sp. NPDC049609]|uniref:hypothetical protein n=1 Tax=Catellatospora sp. NPDC049609 TaxID=3155505 RepID=UPI003425C4D9